MIDVFNLALPFFGLIALGYAAGKWSDLPEIGLAWMNFFLIYVSLPCLFYRVLAQTPFEELNNVPFVVGTTLSTLAVFAISFIIGMAIRGRVAESAIVGIAGAYGNVGYMGPGLALSTLGAAAAAPVALIFCFDSVLAFTLVPLLMAAAGAERRSTAATALHIVKQIVFHPLLIAAALGILSAALHLQPPVALDRLMQYLQNAAAPCALFTLGVTVALRPVERMPWEVPPAIAIKLIVHPAIVLAVLSLIALLTGTTFSPTWVYAAVLMAALPPALSVFVMARQYETWVEQASGCVLFGTLASVVTLVMVMWLVQINALPTNIFQ
jgi:predicted permease